MTAETVRRAARATLAEGSARLRTLWDTEFDPAEIAFGSEGVVDFERRRSRREDRSAKIEELTRKFEERFPWLDDDDDSDDEPMVTYEEGATTLIGTPGQFFRSGTEHRSWRDPTVILDVLAGELLDDVVSEGEDDVRGAGCVRYGGTLGGRRFSAAAGTDPSEAGDRTVHVKAWVDGEGRLVRGSWRTARLARPRSPLRPKHPPVWRTVEFWDFGLPVDIELPEATQHPGYEDTSLAEYARGLAELAVDLWKRRRAWKRRHR